MKLSDICSHAWMLQRRPANERHFTPLSNGVGFAIAQSGSG
jgi:hypothetical protein